MRFPFGKYRGKEINEIVQSEEGERYCRWLVGQDFCPQEVYDYVVYVLGIQ